MQKNGKNNKKNGKPSKKNNISLAFGDSLSQSKLPSKPPGLDVQDAKLQSLLDLCRKNEEVLSKFDNCEDEEERLDQSLIDMGNRFDKVYMDSTEDQETLSMIDKQLESLTGLDGSFQEREDLKNSLLSEVKNIRENPSITFPENYDDVIDRMTNELYIEDRYVPGEAPESDPFEQFEKENQESEEKGLSEAEKTWMSKIKKKLATTLYGFSSNKNVDEKIENELDEEKIKALERIRELDRKLAVAEREEKNVKNMLKNKREKERQKELEEKQQTQEADTKDNLSVVSMSESFTSSMSDSKNLFLTQKRRRPKSKLGTNKNTKILKPVDKKVLKRITPNDSSLSLKSSKSTKEKDFLKINRENVNLSEHEKFLNSMTEPELTRYNALMGEMNAKLDQEEESGADFDSQIIFEELPNPFSDYFQGPNMEEIEEQIKTIIDSSPKPAKLKKAAKVDTLRFDQQVKLAAKKVRKIDEKYMVK